MPKRSSTKDESDVNMIAFKIREEATEEPSEEEIAERKKIAAILGRRGGKKGGPARRDALTSEERKRIASDAAKARWAKRAEGQ